MQIEIEGLSNSGDGIGYTDKKKKIFVPLSIPGDVVEAEIISENSKFIKTKLTEIVENSPNRIEPLCKYFSVCGGCALQHLRDIEYYKFKEEIIKHAISYTGYEVPESIEIKKTDYGARRRCAFKIDSGSRKISFYKKESKDLVSIDSCPILDEDLQNLIAPLNELLKILKSTKTREIFLTKVDNGIECILKTDKEFGLEDSNKIIAFTKEYNLISVGNAVGKERFASLICEFSRPQLHLGNYKIDIPQGSFLQASLVGQNFIIEEIRKNLSGKGKVLDLYSGIGTYTFSIADKVKTVKSVEGDEGMVNSILKNAKANGLSNLVTAEKQDLHHNPVMVKELKNYDLVIINPPRNGATPQCKELASSGVNKIIMVSCNSFTFSNNAKILKDGGYELVSVVGVDQFYRSPHIEIVAVFEKTGV